VTTLTLKLEWHESIAVYSIQLVGTLADDMLQLWPMICYSYGQWYATVMADDTVCYSYGRWYATVMADDMLQLWPMICYSYGRWYICYSYGRWYATVMADDMLHLWLMICYSYGWCRNKITTMKLSWVQLPLLFAIKHLLSYNRRQQN